ncbi:MAG: amidohydrolase family protein, partial [Maricaulaceae bacterium]
MRVVALEEHYTDAEVEAAIGRRLGGPIGTALQLSVEDRIAGMDAAGLDLAVLSLAPPGLQGVTEPTAPDLARAVNDRLADDISVAAGRLGGFAALPTAVPAAAADELTRCVEELGFCGALINGPTGGAFLDAPEFRTILKRAADLRVPIYIHPSDPLAPVRETYLEPYAT